ncbi:MAG TPA: cytochrome c biogenesis protein CcsA, partial [Candidatus Krumholzibacteria bacterium]
MSQRRIADNVLNYALCMWMLVSIALMFFYAPVEQTMGLPQKIFYFHVPLAWNAFLGFTIVFWCSFRYLATRDPKWDARAVAGAEVGVLFTTLVLITGPIWAKPVWGIWWTWDARLTLTLFLWFIYVAYLVMRGAIEDHDMRARYSAVLGILGALLIPFIHLSVYLFRTLHPQPIL